MTSSLFSPFLLYNKPILYTLTRSLLLHSIDLSRHMSFLLAVKRLACCLESEFKAAVLYNVQSYYASSVASILLLSLKNVSSVFRDYSSKLLKKEKKSQGFYLLYIPRNSKSLNQPQAGSQTQCMRHGTSLHHLLSFN